MKLVLRSIENGSQKNLSVNADVKFNVIDVEEEECEYMYDDGEFIYSVDERTFPMSKIADEIAELIPQTGSFRVMLLDGELYKILLPKKARVKIKSTEPSLKGQTAASPYKPAHLYNGWVIQVPVFFDEEDEIIIDTSDLDNPKYDSKP